MKLQLKWMERLLALACTSASTTPPVVPEEGVVSNRAEVQGLNWMRTFLLHRFQDREAAGGAIYR